MQEVAARRPGRPAKIRPMDEMQIPGEDRTIELDPEYSNGPLLSEFLSSNAANIRTRYRETLSKSQALEELAKLRTISQYAAEEINQRLVPDEEQCMVCNAAIPYGVKVPQLVIERDPATGTSHTRVLCSINCIREHNRKKMGLAELVK